MTEVRKIDLKTIVCWLWVFLLPKLDKKNSCLNHSQKKRKDSLETRSELVVQRTYVENQAIVELILFYCA